MAARASSSIMPHPPSRFSRSLMGGGFVISIIRYIIKPVITYKGLSGMSRNTRKIHANSSIMTYEGSFWPDSFSTFPEVITPAAKSIIKMIIYSITYLCRRRHNKSPAKLPTVPGAIGKYPRPSTVAMYLCIFFISRYLVSILYLLSDKRRRLLL